MNMKMSAKQGFTLIELLVVIIILAILGAVAFPRFINQSSSARAASIQAMAGSMRSALGLVYAQTTVSGIGSAGGVPGITFVTLQDGTSVRVWNGYPDRWCDGVGALQQGFTVPAGGCYLSNAAIPYNNYTFYGYGNTQIPGGDAGIRIESAPSPTECSVQYTYNGSGAPVVTAYTSGC